MSYEEEDPYSYSVSIIPTPAAHEGVTRYHSTSTSFTPLLPRSLRCSE